MSLSDITRPYTTDETDILRVLLIGAPGSGKSTAAATFPNPIIFDFDNNTPKEVKGREDVQHIPMYSEAYREEIVASIKNLNPGRKKQYVKYAPLLVNYILCNQIAEDTNHSHTLIFDSVSRYANMVATMIAETDAVQIEKNSFHKWGVFAEYMESTFDALNALTCNQVAIMHEEELRDHESNRIIAYRWLIDGKKFAHKIPQYFGNIFRCIRRAPDTERKFNKDEVAKLEYYWQVQPDSTFPARTTIKTDKRYITPSYESFT